MFAHNNSQQLILAFVGSHWLASRSRYNPFINLSNTYQNFSVNSFRLFFKPKRLTKRKEQFKQVSWSGINFPSRLKLDCYISNFLHSINYLHKLLSSEIGILSRGIKHKWTKCYICICIQHGQPSAIYILIYEKNSENNIVLFWTLRNHHGNARQVKTKCTQLQNKSMLRSIFPGLTRCWKR